MSSSYVSIKDVKEKLDPDEPLDVYSIYKGKKKKLQNQKRREDPILRHRRNENEVLRRAKLRAEDPNYHNKINEKARIRYAKDPGPQIKYSTNWNQKNKKRKNANQRALYAKNRVEICKKIREKRRLKNESNNDIS